MTVRRDGSRICVFEAERLVNVKLTWEWGGGRTSSSGNNGSDSLSTTIGFILSLRITRYADFPPKSRPTANPEAKDAWSLLLCMKRPEEVDLRAAGSVSDDRDRVIWSLALDWIRQAVNILIGLRGQCVIRYIDRLEGLTARLEFRVITSKGLNNSYAWFSWWLDLDDDVVADERMSVNSQLHHCIGGGTNQKVDRWTTRRNDFPGRTIEICTSIRIEDEMKWRGCRSESHDRCQHMNWPRLQGRSSDSRQ